MYQEFCYFITSHFYTRHVIMYDNIYEIFIGLVNLVERACACGSGI